MNDNSGISRHKTAISRANLSRPVQLALNFGLINSECSVFDYGCGRGDDVRGLKALKINCDGWDPTYKPDGIKHEADIVNLGYVVNVIENTNERKNAILEAWRLAKRALVVSARLNHETKGVDLKPFGDGFITAKGTFQKYYSQQELREWIDNTLEAPSVAASPGIFIVFRDKNLQQDYIASIHHRRFSAPVIKNSEIIYENNKDILNSIADFISDRGRLPDDSEVKHFHEIQEKFGTIKRAFAIIRRVTGTEQWDTIFNERSKELLINLALQRFHKRPKFKDLPKHIQLDIKAFFRDYTHACKEADDLLFSIGDLDQIDRACRESTLGKLTQDALYIHVSSIDSLPTILRVYEGCARQYVGFVEGANLIKLHRFKPKVSYLSYPDFDKDPHPRLIGALVVPLQDFKIKYWDSSSSDNPPIIHRKEEFVAYDYPNYKKFARLTKQEEDAGLFDNPGNIGRVQQWNQLLLDKGVRISEHRLIKCGS